MTSSYPERRCKVGKEERISEEGGREGGRERGWGEGEGERKVKKELKNRKRLFNLLGIYYTSALY